MENLTENKKMKIGILSFYYPHLGGSGIVTTRIAEYLAKKGHEIHFIGYDTDENPPHMEKLGVKLHKIRKIDYPALKNEPYVWSLASKIYDVDKEFDLDLIHANYALPHAASAYLARERIKKDGKYLPYLVTGHGSDIHTNGNKNEVNPVLQLSLDEADQITYVSKDLKKIAEEELGISKKGIHLPNFVDKKKFYPKESKLREKLGIPEKAFVIGHVSNFAPVKQTYHFSYLAEHMKADGTLNNTYFLMVGDGREKAQLEERVEKIGVKDHFIFTGKIDQEGTNDAYNTMDAVLLPSKHEGNPLTLLEAMACSKPIIGTNVGGIREVIEDNLGYLFEKGDVITLNKIISELKNNKEKRIEMGINGLKKIDQVYSEKKIMDSYIKIYQKLSKK
jgi:L-malate glycosyltransferase